MMFNLDSAGTLLYPMEFQDDEFVAIQVCSLDSPWFFMNRRV